MAGEGPPDFEAYVRSTCPITAPCGRSSKRADSGPRHAMRLSLAADCGAVLPGRRLPTRCPVPSGRPETQQVSSIWPSASRSGVVIVRDQFTFTVTQAVA